MCRHTMGPAMLTLWESPPTNPQTYNTRFGVNAASPGVENSFYKASD